METCSAMCPAGSKSTAGWRLWRRRRVEVAGWETVVRGERDEREDGSPER